MIGRLLAIITKELWVVWRDPVGRFSILLPPILQLVLFAAASTLEVKNVDIGVYDQDRGAASKEFIAQIAGSSHFRRIVPINSPQALRSAIDDRKVIGVIVFDGQFSRDVAAGRRAAVFVALDGRRSNAAQIVAGYLSTIAVRVGAVLQPSLSSQRDTTVSHLFNPNLDYLWFILPSLLVQIGAISALSLTTPSVARERELGTFDQLMVSPLRVYEILIGKMTPPLLFGLFHCTVYLIVIPNLYGAPMRGSIALFYVALTLFLLAVIGVGMMVSAITQTQQQAFLGNFIVMSPAILLSGGTSPVDNMPAWLQIIAQANPLKHFLVVAEGLFLKAMPAAEVFANTWPLLVIAMVTLVGSALLFRSRLG
jgi:ABC-2 type transport system permease protein